MIYSHFTQAEEVWDKQRWSNFTPKELSCPYSGEYFHDPDFLDRLQALRDRLGVPLNINSAHRSFFWNSYVGGAARSQHKKMAVDISLKGITNPKKLLSTAVELGFRGFGFYNTFLHLDMGRNERYIRIWPKQSERNPQWL